MPNRILREGLLDSERLKKAGEPAEVLFVRLMLVADDFGRFDGRLTVICRSCWPDGGPDEVDILHRLTKLTESGLVVAYEAEGKPFIYIPKFKQRTRAARSKFPDPPACYPQVNPQMAVTRPTDDGPVTDIRARSSSFVVRNSDSGQPVDKSTSTPKAAAQSFAKARHQIEEQRSWTAAPIPEHLKPRVRTHDPEPPPGDHDDGFETLDT